MVVIGGGQRSRQSCGCVLLAIHLPSLVGLGEGGREESPAGAQKREGTLETDCIIAHFTSV